MSLPDVKRVGRLIETARLTRLVAIPSLTYSNLSMTVVLTAAHCLGGSYDVRIGSDSVGSGERIAMKREYEHPSYSTRTDEFDVALLKLDSPADQDIPLVRINGDNNVPDTQTKVTVMGWGDTDPSCLLYTSPSPRDQRGSRMPSSA